MICLTLCNISSAPFVLALFSGLFFCYQDCIQEGGEEGRGGMGTSTIVKQCNAAARLKAMSLNNSGAFPPCRQQIISSTFSLDSVEKRLHEHHLYGVCTAKQHQISATTVHAFVLHADLCSHPMLIILLWI